MKVVVIGGGVSGLSAGCYLQMNGFQTMILEQHESPGGLCTSWNRKGYSIGSGFQWLLGSGPGSPFYELWSELIDMKTLDFVHHEIRMTIETRKHRDISGNKDFHLYTDLNRLEQYLLRIAPEDAILIKKLIREIRRIQSFEIPPSIKKNPAILPWYQKIGYIKHLPLLFFMKGLQKETNFTFASRLKNQFLREAFELLFDGEEKPLMIITIPLAFNDLKGTGYPIGGASALTGRLSERYRLLKGSIRYNARVARIITNGGQVQGVELGSGEQIPADIVLSTADWTSTFFDLLGGSYTDRSMVKLKDLKTLDLFYSIFMVSIGVARSFAQEPHFFRFPIENDLLSPDGTRYSMMEVHIYNYDPTLAPAGKTLISVSFSTTSARYWIDLRNLDFKGYNKAKSSFADEIIEILDKRIGNLKPDIEVIDIVSPATYARYTGNRDGAAQGWMPGKNLIAQSPVTCKVKGLERFYYASHWSQPGGGLPVSIKSTRDAVQLICHDTGTKFRVLRFTGDELYETDGSMKKHS